MLREPAARAERTAGHVLCALCAGPTPIAEGWRGQCAQTAACATSASATARSVRRRRARRLNVVRERDTVPEIVPAVLRTGFAAVPSPSRTTRSAARLGPPPPPDDFDLPFAPAAPWIAPGTPEVDGLTQGTPYLERALATAVPTAAQQLWAAKLDRSAASLDRHARSAAALPTSALPASASVRPCYPASAGRTAPALTSRRAESRTRSMSVRGGSGTMAPMAARSVRGATPPRRPPRRSAPSPGVAAGDGAAASAAAAVGAAARGGLRREAGGRARCRSRARCHGRRRARRAIRSEPSLSFPAWYPTAARLALWPHSTGVPSPAPARSPPAPPPPPVAAYDGTRSCARAAQSAGALRARPRRR